MKSIPLPHSPPQHWTLQAGIEDNTAEKGMGQWLHSLLRPAESVSLPRSTWRHARAPGLSYSTALVSSSPLHPPSKGSPLLPLEPRMESIYDFHQRRAHLACPETQVSAPCTAGIPALGPPQRRQAQAADGPSKFEFRKHLRSLERLPFKFLVVIFALKWPTMA